MNVTEFIETHYRHFNAAVVVDASDCWRRHLEDGGRVFLTLAGAMSTAELGRSLAELIRQDKVHAICCTGANLEEDVFNLVAHEHYQRVPDWRNLTPQREKELELAGLNRVTDTCIPEDRAFRRIEHQMLALWQEAEAAGERRFPHEFVYQLVRDRLGEADFSGDPRNSWILAAAERDLPIFVPGWEDSTLGNILVAHVVEGDLKSTAVVKSGLEAMHALADWYCATTMGKGLSELAADASDGPAAGGEGAHRAVRPEDAERTVGFFQIGGGIAGDFPICVVPMIHQDLRRPCPYWGWFCQIGDSTTSYGSYSGAIPSEKITWGKLDVDTPMFMIESDATIVAPLIFARVLGW
jgi:deoxyhypusine synthase